MFPGQFVFVVERLLCKFVDVEAVCCECILPGLEVEALVPEVELCAAVKCSFYCWCYSAVGACDDCFETGTLDGVELEPEFACS